MAQVKRIYTFELVPITIQELMVLPNLCREQFIQECRYRDNDIKSFRDIALSNGQERRNRVTRKVTDLKDGNQESFREKMFKENCGEWLILDNPVLAVAKDTWEYSDNSTYTPVAIMTVTLNGDNAYMVYLPLSECCSRSENIHSHYYLGGFSWEVRPFEKIMNMLRKGKKIGYTFYVIEESWGYNYGGGFRVFDT